MENNTMPFLQKLKLYWKIYTYKSDSIVKTNNEVFIYFGVVGDLVLFYDFLEQYCHYFSQRVILVTLKNTLPFLQYMDKENSFINFEQSVFFDPNPTARTLTQSDIENLNKLVNLHPNKAFAMPYEIDFYTFLILNLVRADRKDGFIMQNESRFRQILINLLFPKIHFTTLTIHPNTPRIKAHSDAFFSICNNRFDFKPYVSKIKQPKYVVISPFASSKEREYPYTKFKEVSTLLYKKYNLQSVYVGQTNLIEQDTESIQFEYNIPIDLLFDRIQNCAVFIGNDSGLSHIALRYNKKTLVLFSRMEQFGLYFPYNNAIMICKENISEIDPNEIVQKSI